MFTMFPSGPIRSGVTAGCLEGLHGNPGAPAQLEKEDADTGATQDTARIDGAGHDHSKGYDFM